MTTATDKLNNIVASLEAGKTVYVCTCTKQVKVTPKTFASWVKDGLKLFKVAGNSLYMARGRSFDCIDFCTIVIQ